MQEIVKKVERERRLHGAYKDFTIFNFIVALLATPTFHTLLKRADGDSAFNFIWKAIP